MTIDSVGLSRIEDAGLNASAPPQQRWLDGWLLRYCPGKAKRARCINALAAGRLPLPTRLDLAAAVFRDAGLPLVFRVTPFSQPAGLDQQLSERGLRAFDDTHVMVAPWQALQLAQALPTGSTLQAVDALALADIVGDLRGSPPEQRRAHGQRLLASPVRFGAWVLRQDGAVLACGQAAREGDIVGLYDVFTAPAARNRGLARSLCAELLRHAGREGARTAYLQVDAANLPARAVYARLGFVDGYHYHYRTADPDAA